MIMENEEKLKKINKELKVYINEASFISIKLRNKLIKMFGEEFSIKLPVENFKNLDVELTIDGNIVMRDEEYKREGKLSFSEIEERFTNFSEKADVILKKKEINYYNMNDKSNIINVLILVVYLILFIAALKSAIESFIVGDYGHIVWLIAIIFIFFVPSLRDRIEQAINFIKRKLKR